MSDVNVAWYCQECGRVEAPAAEKWCPDCGDRMQRCSRYEWFLADALEHHLWARGCPFKIKQQYRLYDHRDFFWYFDIMVEAKGPAGKVWAFFIEVNGSQHGEQKVFSGQGGCGMTRDDHKRWEFNEQMAHQPCDLIYVSNEDCAKRGGAVEGTAEDIVERLCRRVGLGR